MSPGHLILGLLATILLIAGGFSLVESTGRTAPITTPPTGEIEDLRERLIVLEDAYLDALGRLAELEASIAPAVTAAAFPEELDDNGRQADDADEETRETEPERAGRDQRVLLRVEQAGLSVDEYQSYESRAYELYLENFEQEWLQQREAYLNGDRIPGSRERLRAELGDDAYDRYLYANGSANRVKVRRVLPGSAAQQAGLNEGDVLLAYDGERLFTFEDLRAASYRGEPGELATLEVRRADGTVTQVALPRGPMGISGQRGWREAPDG